MSSIEKCPRPTVPEGDMVLRALKIGGQRALRIHKAIGNPIATFEDGKVVIVQPEDIKIDEPLENLKVIDE